MSYLLVTAMTPTLSSGTGLRTYGVAAALARHAEVEVAYVPFGGSAPAPQYDTLPRVSLRQVHVSRGPDRAVSYLRARAHGVPSDLARGVSAQLTSVARAAPASKRVIADGPVPAAAMLGLTRRRQLIYLAHNLESAFRDDAGSGDLAAFESKVLRMFSDCWMATRADARGAVALAGRAVTTRYVPNVVDVERIEPVAPAGAATVLFVGDFTYEPNRQALDYLVHAVLPAAWERRPELRLLVVGRGLSDRPGDERVEARGFVDDLRTAYAAADVVAVPLLHGGGSPLKFVEALAYGLPVIATSHAARLLEDGVPGEHFLMAAGPAEFAEAIDKVLSDPGWSASVAKSGREMVRRCYSVDALATLLAP